MRFLILLLLIIIHFGPLSAQTPPVRDSTRFRGMMKDSSFFKNMPQTGKVIGVLRDSASREPMEFASVALLRSRDSSIAGGTLTDAKGNFRMEELMPGRYFIRITSIGYRQLDSKPFLLTPQDPLKDFGNVWMPPSQRILKEAEVVGEKVEYTNSLDKKVYNVDKTLINAGGSVSEVLQNIPSVNVDIDGKISLRGSEQVTVLIDGKPAGLTGDNRGAILQQLPASSIEEIEVVTNPSSKYDAEGTSGIINIKTKKGKNPGINGNITVGAGTNDKYNASLSLNRRTKKSNSFFNYSYRDDRRDFSSNTTRTNTYFPGSLSYFISDGDGYNDNISNNFRAGIDLYLNDYNTLGFSGSFNDRIEYRDDDNFTREENALRSVVGGFDRFSKTDEDNQIADGSIDYRRTFPGSKKELTASMSMNRSDRTASNDLATTFPYDVSLSDLKQQLNTSNVSYNGTAQVDFVLPQSTFKLEMGLKTTYRSNDSRQSSDRYDFDTQEWINDDTFTDRFIFDEWVYAGYLQWSGRWKIFELSAGLRAEQTLLGGTSESADTSFTRDFLNLFPSGAIKYTFSEGKDIQLSYSRRISRPREQQLNPFRNISDSINVFVGNPGIMPELTNSLELGYVGRFGEQSYSFSVFYRQTLDNSQRFRTVDDSTQVSTQTFVNYGSSENLGFEFVLRNSFLKLFTTSLSATLFYNVVDGTNIAPELSSEVWSGDVRGSVSVRVNKQFSLQLTGNYMAPREQPQGTFRGMSGVDFGFKYEFKGGKWTLNGSVSDIFDQRNFTIDNRAVGVRLEAVRKRETRVGSFTLTYRFGKAEQTRDRRRGSRGAEQMQQNDMMDF